MFLMTTGGAKSGLSFMAFLVFLLLVAWCMKIYRSRQQATPTAAQKIMDIIGVILLLGLFVLTVVPVLK